MLLMNFNILPPFVCTFRVNAQQVIKNRNTNQFKEYNELSP